MTDVKDARTLTLEGAPTCASISLPWELKTAT
jgi:hypothetical protein